MKTSRWFNLLSLCVVSVLLSGCIAPHTKITDLSPDSLQQGKSVAIVYALECAEQDVWSGRCTESSGFKKGGDFVTDPPNVSRAASSIGEHDALRSATAALDVKQVMQNAVAEHFKPVFESSGLNVTTGTTDVKHWALPQRSKHFVIKFGNYHRDRLDNDEARTGFAVTFNPDYQSVIQDLNTDYLLVVENLRYGVVRKYSPGISIALELPTAVAAVRVTLYEANVADPIYDNIASRRAVPDFEWKTPPDFAKLMALPPLVMDAVIKDVANEFF